MPKYLQRLIGVLLVACLLVDFVFPVEATSYKKPIPPAPSLATLNEQAFSLPLESSSLLNRVLAAGRRIQTTLVSLFKRDDFQAELLYIEKNSLAGQLYQHYVLGDKQVNKAQRTVRFRMNRMRLQGVYKKMMDITFLKIRLPWDDFIQFPAGRIAAWIAGTLAPFEESQELLNEIDQEIDALPASERPHDLESANALARKIIYRQIDVAIERHPYVYLKGQKEPVPINDDLRKVMQEAMRRWVPFELRDYVRGRLLGHLSIESSPQLRFSIIRMLYFSHRNENQKTEPNAPLYVQHPSAGSSGPVRGEDLVRPIPGTHPQAYIVSDELFSLLALGESDLNAFSVSELGSPREIAEDMDIAMALEAIRRAKVLKLPGVARLEKLVLQGNVIFFKKSSVIEENSSDLQWWLWQTSLNVDLDRWRRDHPEEWAVFVHSLRDRALSYEKRQGMESRYHSTYSLVDDALSWLTDPRNASRRRLSLQEVFPVALQDPLKTLLRDSRPKMKTIHEMELVALDMPEESDSPSYFEMVIKGLGNERLRVFRQILKRRIINPMISEWEPDTLFQEGVLYALAKKNPQKMTSDEIEKVLVALQHLEIPVETFFGDAVFLDSKVRQNTQINAGWLATIAAVGSYLGNTHLSTIGVVAMLGYLMRALWRQLPAARRRELLAAA